MPDIVPAREHPEWFRWVQAGAEGGMVGAVFFWCLCAAWACLFGLAVCAAIVWEIVAAMWRLWPRPL